MIGDFHSSSPVNASYAITKPGLATVKIRFPSVRQLGYAYFDSRLSWFSNAWSYEGAYNIYKGGESGPLDQYVLRDAGERSTRLRQGNPFLPVLTDAERNAMR